jgi:hypothetical protein
MYPNVLLVSNVFDPIIDVQKDINSSDLLHGFSEHIFFFDNLYIVAND